MPVLDGGAQAGEKRIRIDADPQLSEFERRKIAVIDLLEGHDE